MPYRGPCSMGQLLVSIKSINIQDHTTHSHCSSSLSNYLEHMRSVASPYILNFNYIMDVIVRMLCMLACFQVH